MGRLINILSKLCYVTMFIISLWVYITKNFVPYGIYFLIVAGVFGVIYEVYTHRNRISRFIFHAIGIFISLYYFFLVVNYAIVITVL